jgi:putative ABC transport system ATP-binding protein/lipoprotein-releasing system ATP-binding protein
MIEVQNLTKSFGEPQVDVLKGLTFHLPDEKLISISGRSGSGKSTLLYCLSTLDKPTQGEVIYNGRNLKNFSAPEIHQFRNQQMGFVFQFHYLLPELTAIENVLMPARKTHQHAGRQKRARELLERFDLPGKLDRLPKHLSGGEQQRVAIARALIMEPRYIFADEPTGNLDSTNADIVMNILKEVTRQNQATVIFVTHDPDFAATADHQIKLVDGQLAFSG